MGELNLHQKVPNNTEKNIVGISSTIIQKGTKEYNTLVANNNIDIKFKDEEGSGSDMIMNYRTMLKLNSLAGLVKNEWQDFRLRVTEAWDENMEHKQNSTHYEGRGVDLTTFPKDPEKYGRLGQLAVDAGFDWVYFENSSHIHASNARDLNGEWKSSQQIGTNPRWILKISGKNGAWKEYNSKSEVITRSISIQEIKPGIYRFTRENDRDMLLFLGASEKTAGQILSLNPPESYIEITRLNGSYDIFNAKWVGLSWRLHPNGNVRDIRMLSSEKQFTLA